MDSTRRIKLTFNQRLRQADPCIGNHLSHSIGQHGGHTSPMTLCNGWTSDTYHIETAQNLGGELNHLDDIVLDGDVA